jgi:fatty acid desaturase
MEAAILHSFGPAVPWKDLVPMTRREKLNEILLPIPWLISSVYGYQQGWIPFGLFCSFYFFLTGLRVSHGAQHYSLGLPRRAQDWALFALSTLMMGSMHAVQVSHLNHHRHCLEEEDYEGGVAREGVGAALCTGPLFILRLHLGAWHIGAQRSRRWIAAELACVGALAIYAVLPEAAFALACHISVMLIGECFTGFFAVWTVHHDCEDASGRTQRGDWLNRMSYNMFLHNEHHSYPAVPTVHLHRLANRMDTQARAITSVLPIRRPRTVENLQLN